jgi:uncharacterized membrane protein SpoIIM required for sporulation
MEILKHPDLSKYLLLTVIILLFGLVIGLLFNSSDQLFNFENSPVLTMTTFQVFHSLIIRNLIATFLILSLSILGIRLIPILFLLINGYNMGMTIALLNYNPYIIFATLFPHGYIEFPLLIFTGACSFIILMEIRKTGLNAYTLLTKHHNPKVRYILKNYLIYPYIIIIIPLVIISASIEATFTFWNLRIAIGGI